LDLREKQVKWHQIGSAGVLLAFGLFISIEAKKLGLGRIIQPGPGFFPFVMGIGLTIGSLALVMKYALTKEIYSGFPRTLWRGLKWTKVIYSCLALLFYAFLLESIGYLLSTFVLMMFLFRVIGRQSYVVTILGGVIVSFSSYLLFKVWLQVQLPLGFLGF